MPEVASGKAGLRDRTGSPRPSPRNFLPTSRRNFARHSNCCHASLRIEPTTSRLYPRALRIQGKNPMPLTTLDPNTALIVVDLQKGIANASLLHPIADIIARTRALLDIFRANNLTVVLVNVAGRAPGRTEQGPRTQPSRSPTTGPTSCPSSTSNPPTSSSPSEAGAPSQPPISNQQLKARGVTQVGCGLESQTSRRRRSNRPARPTSKDSTSPSQRTP